MCPRFTAINIISILKYSGYVWNVKIFLVAFTQSLFQKKKKTKESFWWMTQFIMWFLTTD